MVHRTLWGAERNPPAESRNPHPRNFIRRPLDPITRLGGRPGSARGVDNGGDAVDMATVVRTHHALDDPQLVAAWRRLSATSPCASLFNSYEWCRSWEQAVGQGCRPWILRVADAATGQTLGLLPLCMDEAGPVRWLKQMGRDLAGGEHLDLLTAPRCHDICMVAILAELERQTVAADGLVIGELDPASSTLSQLGGWASRNGYPWLLREYRIVPFTDLPETFEEYLVGRSGSLRHEIQRRRRELAGYVDGRMDLVRSEKDVDQLLAGYFDLLGRRPTKDSATGQSPHTGAAAFIRAICADAAGHDWLRAFVLRAGGQISGVLIGFHWHDTAHFHCMVTNPESTLHQPGTLLVAASIEQAVHEGLRRYEFPGRDEEQHLEWTSQWTQEVTLVAAMRLPARLAVGAEHDTNGVAHLQPDRTARSEHPGDELIAARHSAPCLGPTL